MKMADPWLMAVALAAVAGFALAGLWGRHKAVRANRQRHCMEAFFAQADRLLGEEGMPEPLRSDVTVMARNLRSGRVARQLVGYAITGRLSRAVQHPPEAVQERVRVLQQAPESVIRGMAALHVYFLFAASYQSVFAGALVRRMLLTGVSPAQARHDPVGSETARRLVQGVLGTDRVPAAGA